MDPAGVTPCAERGGNERNHGNGSDNWEPDDRAAARLRSTRNNIITTKYARIFEDPSAPPEERIKAIGARSGFYARERDADGNYVEVHLDKNTVAGLSDPDVQDQLRLQEWKRETFQGEWGTLKAFMTGAFSPDGLNWTDLEELLLEEFVDRDKVVFDDEVLGKYVAASKTATSSRETR